MQGAFIVIWVLTSIAVVVYLTRLGIRFQTKKLGLDDFFLGIGAIIMLETYILGTVVSTWVQGLEDAIQTGDLIYILDNAPRLIRAWYSTSATYIFMIWFIKLGIALFLVRLSNNILKYGRWRHVLLGWIIFSFTCVVVIFWTTCPPGDFVTETLASEPPHYERCYWKVQVITPAVFNVVADIILFIYPFPIIFMANIPKSLRYSLLGIFALCGVVTGSAIVRVAFMSAENFLQQGNVYAISYWGAIEGAVSLLVASLPVIGGRMIAKWRHILLRTTKAQSLNISRAIASKSRHSQYVSQNTMHSMNDMKYPSGAFNGTEKTVETVISAGSTLAEASSTNSNEEPVSLMQHVARMGRLASRSERRPSEPTDPNSVTIRKEIFIREETKSPGLEPGSDNNV